MHGTVNIKFIQSVCLDTVCASFLPDIQAILLPDDTNRDGSRNCGLLAIQPPDAAARLRKFQWNISC